MSDYGPSRREHWFRLLLSLAGFALLIYAVWRRGVQQGPAMYEVVVFGGLVLGGSILWSAWKLWKGRR
jgi:hypothetical protein